MAFDCILRGGTVVFPESPERRADIAVRDGRIAGLLAPGETAEAGTTIDVAGKHVFPGCMDAHQHFGFAEPITEYRTETASAAIGGLTTILSYFLSSGPYAELFEPALAQCAARAHVDFAFHFTTCVDAHIDELPRSVADHGVTSFKYFMNFKGEEGRYMGLSGTDDGYLYDLMAKAATLPGAVLVCHPENIELFNRNRNRFIALGRDTLRDWSLAKPAFTEWENMVRAMVFAAHHGATLYVPHVSCARGVEEANRFRERYDRIHIETCPHYLTHTMESDLGILAKANPPLRTAEDVEALWAYLADGSIDVVGADHVPRKRATKEKPLWQSAQGFPGSATILPVLLSEGHHKRGLPLRRIAQLVAKRPAEIFGIAAAKGDIFIGADADFTVVDLDLEKVCRWQDLASHADYTPYEGWTFKGWPVMTILRGNVVMRDGKLLGQPGYGRYLRRPMV